MPVMTKAQHEPTRDIAGRFAPQDHSDPELTLTEQYLEDDSNGSDFDMHDFYDITPEAPGAVTGGDDSEGAFSTWLEEQRTPQGMDEYFDRPNPALTPIAPAEQIAIGAWGSGTPF